MDSKELNEKLIDAEILTGAAPRELGYLEIIRMEQRETIRILAGISAELEKIANCLSVIAEK